MTKRKMHLIANLKTGPSSHNAGGWRHPEATIDDILSPSRYEDAARVMEAAKLDGLFFADLFGIADTYGNSPELFLRVGGQHNYLDPMVVLPLMARVTRHLGLGATISTSFCNPYQLARSLQSLDVISGGRVAWNVVTSSNNLEAQNAGMDQLHPHDERYDRADEIVEACMALWNSWQPDSFVMDKVEGMFVDPSKVSYANYAGRWTKTRGPLATPPSPQGHPVIMQAGSSERGRTFAARWAEVIFAPLTDIPTMKEFYDDMQQRFERAGRAPNSCKILTGLTTIVGETESIARERADYIASLQPTEYDLAYYSMALGTDLGKADNSGTLSSEKRGNQGGKGIEQLLEKIAEKENTSVKEATKSRGKYGTVVGTAAQVADHMQEAFEAHATDGFVLMPQVFPISHEQFCRSVVPELQRREIFRREYSASTLRGNLQDD